MAAWRYEFSLVMLKKYFSRSLRSLVKYILARIYNFYPAHLEFPFNMSIESMGSSFQSKGSSFQVMGSSFQSMGSQVLGLRFWVRFLLYTNAIINTSTILKLILFADDTNVFVSHRDKDCLSNILNAELNKLLLWFRANRLSSNLKKNKFIVFKPCQKRTNQTILP